MNALIGCATGYDWSKLWPFVSSARKHAPDCKIVLFVHNNDADTLNQLAEHDVWVVPVEPRAPWVPAYMDPQDTLSRWELPAEMHVVCWRFIAMYCFLMRFGHEFDRIMLTDVRDVLLAGDPFEFDWSTDRACFMRENETMTMGSCPYNSVGMVRADRVVAKQLHDAPIVCDGVIAGTVGPVVAILEKFIDCCLWAPTDTMLTDQIIFRWLIHKFPAMVKVYGSAETPVRHVGYFKIEPPPLEGAALIHQADRFPALNDELIEQLT